MPAPNISAVSPATLVAGAAPVTVTLTGTDFLEDDTVVTSVTPGITVTSSTWVSATEATCKIAASGSAKRNTRISLTVTTTDGADTDVLVTPKVVNAAVNGGALDQYPANPIPGATPGTTGDAIASKTETTHQKLNPAFDPANETGVESQQGSSALWPGIASPPGGDDHPGADADERDQETVPTDHSAQVPLAPTAVTAAAGIAGHATVSWTAPANANENSEYDVTTYTIVGTSSDGGTLVTTTTTGTPAAVTKDVAGLTSTKTYTFTVTATSAGGTGPASSASSSVVIV